MGTGFEHTALAIFTTLAPMGALSFIAIAYVFFAGKPNADEVKRLDKWTTVSAAVLIVGFLGAFMHLSNPLNAFGVFSGVGASLLSNEVLVGVVLVLSVLLYLILALTGKLALSVRKVFLVVLVVLAVLFAIFCGLAYMVYTIPTWNTPFSIVQMVGYALAGGTILGFCLVGVAHIDVPKSATGVALTLALIGIVVGAFGFGAQIAGLSDLYNIWGPASSLVPAIWGVFAVYVICGLIGTALMYFASKKAFSPSFMIPASIVITAGIFIARIGFYGLYMGIAL